MDAIAVGGGLAGTAFALELARQGAKVTILERTSGLHHKVCGDFLSGEAKTLLRHFGIDPHALGGTTIRTLSLADRTSEARAPLPFEAVGLSRCRLDEALLETAAARGITVIRGATVEGIEDDGSGVIVRTSNGFHRARTAALASGKHNIRGIARPLGPMSGFKMHLKPTPAARATLDGLVRLVAFRGGYAGLCLVEDGTLSVAWNIQSSVLNGMGASWKDQSDTIAGASPLFGDLVSGAEPLWSKPLAVSGLPYGFLRTTPTSPAVYPVGDQLAVIPSFAGDGTSLALASGIAAARAVIAGESACAFQKRLVAGHRTQFRLVGALDRVIASPLLRRVGISVAQRVPQMVTALAGATRLRGLTDLITADQVPALRPARQT
ncbi:MAG TPA: FAD-dependent monooxygenase [Hyphomicrobium sp.]|nr:FAD-dependent monooxygenase [Hyphomicrobium sp.]